VKRAAEPGEACDLLLYRTQLARVQHLGRVWGRMREVQRERLERWLRASADLALVREGLTPGFGGDHALRKARDKAEKTSVAPTVLKDHPIDLMFKRGQLKPEWRWLFDAYIDLSETAEGGSVGVVDLDKYRVQTGGVPQFRTAQLQAIQDLEVEFKAPIRARADARALAVFEATHRPGRAALGVKELAAQGTFGKRKTVGQLLQRAYEALADHHGVTAARARARYRREPGSQSVAGIAEPLTAAERAEIDAHEAAIDAEVRERQAAAYQQGKERAAETQRARRRGAR
jgi:hypothetical protein